MHNGQTADPLNRFAIELKKLNGKRNKTDADYEQIARIEFAAGLYMSESGPVLPFANIESMMILAAKKTKEGPTAKSAVFCLQDASLVYEGPRDVEGLWKDDRFRFSRIVRVGTARVARMRPIFLEWSAFVTLRVEIEQVNPERVNAWMQTAGDWIGLGDWRPQYGRFSAQRIGD